MLQHLKKYIKYKVVTSNYTVLTHTLQKLTKNKSIYVQHKHRARVQTGELGLGTLTPKPTQKRESNLQGKSREWRISDNTWSAAEACIQSCLQGSHKIGRHLREEKWQRSELSVAPERLRRRTLPTRPPPPGVAPTVQPANAKRLQDGEEQQSHPAAGVVVKQLEDVESTLRPRQRAAS